MYTKVQRLVIYFVHMMGDSLASSDHTCVGSGVWGVECGEWSVESGMWGVECGEWGVECGEWNVGSGMWGVECGEWKHRSNVPWWEPLLYSSMVVISLW